MNIFHDIAQILRKPFPEIENNLVYFRILLMLSVFVTLFLYVFQPFGIATLESYKFLICVGFGAMTFLGAAVYEFIFHKIFKLRERQKKWTFGKWILDNLGIMLFISLANFLFARLLLFGYIQWSLFPQMMYSTLMIGVIPLVAIGGLSLFKNEKKYQLIAHEINQAKTSTSSTKDSSNRMIFDIPIHQIRYIEALQNYAKIGYINREGDLKVKIERTTLKQILAETEETAIIKSHKSYLVNKDTITATAGNAQGLLLTLADCDKHIPVSRTRVSFFR